MMTIRTSFAAAAAAVALLLSSTAATADSDRRYNRGWHGHDRGYDKRKYNKKESRAYERGYRAAARDNRDYRPGYRYDNRRYDNVRYNNGRYNNASYNNGRYWWGRDGRINCRRDDGTTGLIVGALAGGTLGNVVAGHGDKVLGSVIGGTLGAIIGKEVDKGNARCR
ncbi:MAG: glycine zipper 2TM domain-containing protein [Sphingomonadaceae bacterium]